jgi:predicted membrane protein
LNDKIPLDMRIEVGAGKTDLTLGSLSLSNLELQEGAGENTIDLRGAWKSNVSVWIEGGVGKTTVQLPQDVGAKVEVEQGLGAVNAGSLMKQGGAYVNQAYGKSSATVSVNIKSGVGEVDLDEGGAPAVN